MRKLNYVYTVWIGLMTYSNLGTHYLFISTAIIVSDVLMKMTLGKNNELCTD